MTQEQVRNVIERVVWTAVQAFLAAWALSNFTFSKGAAVGALAAALSAVKNLAQTWSNK